ncbi:MAG: TPM domain-containing protein [Coriobacteriia bacterium]
MRRPLKTLGVALFALLLAFPIAPAFAGTYVLDEADVIDAETEARIESLSERVESSTPGAEIAVVTVKSLDGLEIEEYAEERFERLGVGSAKLDNGVLLLIAPNERRVRIEVGYGLEGAMPDARAGRIIDELIIPAFQAGDMAGGIELGHAEIAAVVIEEYGSEVPGVADPETSATSGWVFLLWLALGVAGFVGVMVWMGKKGWLKNTGGGGGSSWAPPTSGSTWGGSSSGSSSGGDSGGGGFGGGDSGGGGASGGW